MDAGTYNILSVLKRINVPSSIVRRTFSDRILLENQSINPSIHQASKQLTKKNSATIAKGDNLIKQSLHTYEVIDIYL